jgi:hypothetical protein
VAVVTEAVAARDVAGVLGLQEHVGFADAVALVIELLAEDLEVGVGVEREEVVLRDREHAAGAARGVVEGLHDALRAQDVVVAREEQVDHQADDLARGEVLTRGLVGLLREAPDQVLEDRAHHVVRHDLGMQVDLGEALHHEEENVRLVELGDLLGQLEALEEDLADVLGEALDVGEQVRGEVVRIVEQPPEVELADVVEVHARQPLEDGRDVLQLATLNLRVPRKHLLLAGLEHAVEPPQHREGQDDLAEVVLFEVAPQQIRDGPQEGRSLREGLELLGRGRGSGVRRSRGRVGREGELSHEDPSPRKRGTARLPSEGGQAKPHCVERSERDPAHRSRQGHRVAHQLALRERAQTIEARELVREGGDRERAEGLLGAALRAAEEEAGGDREAGEERGSVGRDELARDRVDAALAGRDGLPP